MKTNLIKYVWLLIFPLLMGCNNSEEERIGSPVEMFDVLMFVTNDADEDLVKNSDKYYHTVEKFRFDSWEIYLDGKLIQTADDKNKYNERDVNYLQEVDCERKNIRLDSHLAIQERINDYTEWHVAEYVVTSASLFGDTKKHTIRMEFRCIMNDYGFPTIREYMIDVDGVKQVVYYPEHFEDLFPKTQYDYINYPYFILNVDAL